MGTLDFGGISPLGINLPPKHVFGCRERPANPYRVCWRSVQGTKKRKKKARFGWTFHPTPKRPPLRTLFVLCMWGGVTDVITHAKFYLNRFSSFGSPGGRNSPFHPTPKRPPLRTLFVLCMWGGVTDVITHAKFHLNRFSSFGSPGGRNSPFPIGLENGSYNSVTH